MAQQIVKRGDRLAIQASDWNETLRNNLSHRIGQGFNTGRTGGSISMLVKNTSGADWAKYSVVQLGAGVANTPAADLELFKSDPIIHAVNPDNTAATWPRMAVTQEAIINGDLGLALISGVTPVYVNVTDTTHRYAQPVSGSNSMTSGDWGPVEILYSSGTGSQWIYGLVTNVVLKKPYVHFKLYQQLTTSDPSKLGTIVTQYGPGMDHTATGAGAITLLNYTVNPSGRKWSGDLDDRGVGVWVGGTQFLILDLQC